MDELAVLLATTYREYITNSINLESDSCNLDDSIGLGGESCGLEIECDEDHNGRYSRVALYRKNDKSRQKSKKRN